MNTLTWITATGKAYTLYSLLPVSELNKLANKLKLMYYTIEPL